MLVAKVSRLLKQHGIMLQWRDLLLRRCHNILGNLLIRLSPRKWFLWLGLLAKNLCHNLWLVLVADVIVFCEDRSYALCALMLPLQRVSRTSVNNCPFLRRFLGLKLNVVPSLVLDRISSRVWEGKSRPPDCSLDAYSLVNGAAAWQRGCFNEARQQRRLVSSTCKYSCVAGVSLGLARLISWFVESRRVFILLRRSYSHSLNRLRWASLR